MKVVDVIFALVCGRVIGFLVSDFLREFGITTNAWEDLTIWLLFPLLALFCLWVCQIIGSPPSRKASAAARALADRSEGQGKFLFVFQGAKHLLVGAFATVIDLKLFEFLIWVFASMILINSLAAKAISFIFSTLIKYWGNKYWAFQKNGKEHIKEEITQFFLITLVGLVIDVSVFYCATQLGWVQASLAGRQISIEVWTKVSVIIAALIAAIWNFLGYKFFVFKK